MLYNAHGICKTFNKELVINGFQISLEMGDFVAIAGKRGTGLTTITQILAGIIKPDEGEIYFEDGLVGSSSSAKKLTKLRRKNIGYVATEPVLVPDFTVYENLLMGVAHSSMSSKAKQKKAKEVLNTLGLKGLGRFFPKELTLVEKQKVCIGRAMMIEPDIIFMDEPTDIFESYEAEQILEIMEILNSAGYTLVVATHSKKIAARTRKIVPVSCDFDISTWNCNAYFENTAQTDAFDEISPEEEYLRGTEDQEESFDSEPLDEGMTIEEYSEKGTEAPEDNTADSVDEVENEILNLDLGYMVDALQEDAAEESSEAYDDGYGEPDDYDDRDYDDGYGEPDDYDDRDYDDGYGEPGDYDDGGYAGDYDDAGEYDDSEEYQEDEYYEEEITEEELLDEELYEEGADPAALEQPEDSDEATEDFKVDLSDIFE